MLRTKMLTDVEIHRQIYDHQGTGKFMVKDHSVSDVEAPAVLEQKQGEGMEDCHFERKYVQLVWIPFYASLFMQFSEN